MLVPVILALLGLSGVGGQAPLQSCGGAWQSARLVADQQSGCRRFWQCQVDGGWASLDCPHTLLFSDDKQLCDWPGQVACRAGTADPCSPNPCSNGGLCVASSGAPICLCPPGTSGPLCTGGAMVTASPGSTPSAAADPCMYPCPRGAVHPYPDLRHPGKGWFCINGVLTAFDCSVVTLGQAPFYDAITHACVGSLACSSSPCRNGGTCAPHGDSFYCTCLAPFSGPTCTETSAPPTTATPTPATPTPATAAPTGVACQYPCVAGALFLYPDLGDQGRFWQCLNGQLQSFSCLAVAGPNKTFYDPTAFDCVAGNVCQSRPCQNNGVCSPSPASPGFSCTCPPPFSGTTCSGVATPTTTPATTTRPVSSVCNPGPCQNGGQCLDIGGRPYCLCPSNFGGATCSEGAVTPGTTPTTPPGTPDPRCVYPCPLGAAYLFPDLRDSDRFVQCYNGSLTSFSCSQVTQGSATYWDQETFYCLTAPRQAF